MSGKLLGYHVEAALATDVGNNRDTNQDHGRCVRPHDPRVLAEKGVLVVVADGLGGHAAGEVASRLAVETVHRVYYDHPGPAAQALADAVASANHEIYESAQGDERLRGMGTTCAALALCGDTAACAHVGDTRVYLVRGNGMYAMTEDHSSVQELVTRGLLSAENARHHADKNVLLRAVGTHPSVDVTTWQKPFPLQAGDRFLVCSDGLHTLVDDEEMKDIAVGAVPTAACEQLIALAKQRGGYDNITVALVVVSTMSEPKQVRDTQQSGVPS
jgi:protein phosphatase